MPASIIRATYGLLLVLFFTSSKLMAQQPVLPAQAIVVTADAAVKAKTAGIVTFTLPVVQLSELPKGQLSYTFPLQEGLVYDLRTLKPGNGLHKSPSVTVLYLDSSTSTDVVFTCQTVPESTRSTTSRQRITIVNK